MSAGRNPKDMVVRTASLAWAGGIAILLGLPVLAVSAIRHGVGDPAEEVSVLPGFTADAASRPGHGLVVTSLRSGSEAQSDGVAVGDRVLSIDNHRVETLDQAEQAIRKRRSEDVTLRLVHGDRPLELVLHMSAVKRHES